MKTEHNLKKAGYLYLALFVVVFLLTWVGTGHCQVGVALAPDAHPQFLNSSGLPLAGGFLYTYQAGTNVLQNTYVDSTGTVQNPDPIPLDATGAPSNGSTQTGIWLANLAYKFCAYDVNLVQQWCTDNVTTYFGLLNQTNTWRFQQTFTLPIIDTATDSQLVFGAAGNQTTVDFPPPTGNVTLHAPNTSDTLVGRATTDTLTNKSLTTPILNGIEMVNGPATYSVLPNLTTAGTITNGLAIIGGTTASNFTAATTSTTGGVAGICVANCGATGSAVVQQSGQAPCIFDGATTFNDAVIASPTTAGDCEDAGLTSAGNSIGIVQSTNGVAGTYTVLLNNLAGGAGSGASCADGTTTTVNANVTTFQTLKSCTFPAGALNNVGKAFRLTYAAAVNAGSAINSVLAFGAGTSSLSIFPNLVTEASSSNPYFGEGSITCVVQTAGASGSLGCSRSINLAGSGSPVIAVGQCGLATLGGFCVSPINLTGVTTFGIACSFASGSGSNACTQTQQLVERLN